MGETPAVQTFQPSTRIGGAIEKWWTYEVSPQNSRWVSTEGFSQMKLEPDLLEANSAHLETLTLGHPRNHFLQNHPTKKLPQKHAKTSSFRFIQLIRSTNHGEFQKWSAANRCQHQNSPTKIKSSNPFHLLTLLDLPVWTITHPRSLHEVVSDTNLIEELLGAYNQVLPQWLEGWDVQPR